MAQEKQAKPYRIFYNGNVPDPSTRWALLAADVFTVFLGIAFFWAVFGHFLGLFT